MKKIENFMLPEHTNKLYQNEAISSISLTKEVADKINEIVNALNELSETDLLWKHEQEGRIRKGVLYMKDNLINSLNELMETLRDSGFIDDRIEYHCEYMKKRLDNLFAKVTDGTTTFDAEIIDGRLDTTGVSKKTIGEHIRESFNILCERLVNSYLESIGFYSSFSNVSYLGDPAYNRLGNAQPNKLDKDILATAPHGYKVSVTVWDDEKLVGDSGWCDKVVIPKNFDVKFGVKKVDDSAIALIDIHKVTFEIENVYVNDVILNDALEYTSGGYYSNIRLSAKYVTVEKPVTIVCPNEYSVAVKVYRIDSGERVYQRDTGWCKTATLQTNLEHEVTFKKDDETPIFRNDLHNIYFNTNIVKNDNVKSVCHRGYNIGAPENTLSAYRLAKKNGFKYVECDVSFTSDNVGVLLHDNTIDRTSNGSGEVNTMTYDELSLLDFGSWFDEKYAGEKIPTFEEFIILCRNLGLHPYIEIKYGANQSQIESLVDIVKRHGMKGKVSYISFEHTILSHVFNKEPYARIGYVTNVFTSETLSNIEHLNANKNLFIDLNIGNVTDENVQLAMDNDLSMEVWTVNNAKNILNTDTYVSGFTTDYVLTECLMSEVV